MSESDSVVVVEEETVVPLGIPPIRQWELDENSTRYDRLVAAPTDDDLSIIWTAWVVTSWVVAAFIFTVVFAILVNWKARQNAFNIYLVFLMISDFVFSFLCGFTCLFNRLSGHYFAPWMCRFQSFYCIWGIGSSIWMNALIAWQVHTMLRSSHIRLRYQVPSRNTVIQQSLLVYLLNAIIAGLGVLPYEANFPHRSYAVNGEACLPTEYNVPSTFFMFLGFFPAVAGIPVAYILWVTIDVFRKGLVPPSGRRRALSIYFARITLSLLVMWVPFFLMVFAAAKPWVNFAGGTWSHLQGAVSAGFGLLKPDTRRAYVTVWWECNWYDKPGRARQSWVSQQFLESWVGTRMSSGFFTRKNNASSSNFSSANLGFGFGSSVNSDFGGGARKQNDDNPSKPFSSFSNLSNALDLMIVDDENEAVPEDAFAATAVAASKAELHHHHHQQQEEERESAQSNARELYDGSLEFAGEIESIPVNSAFSETQIIDDPEDDDDEYDLPTTSRERPSKHETPVSIERNIEIACGGQDVTAAAKDEATPVTSDNESDCEAGRPQCVIEEDDEGLSGGEPTVEGMDAGAS